MVRNGPGENSEVDGTARRALRGKPWSSYSRRVVRSTRLVVGRSSQTGTAGSRPSRTPWHTFDPSTPPEGTENKRRCSRTYSYRHRRRRSSGRWSRPAPRPSTRHPKPPGVASRQQRYRSYRHEDQELITNRVSPMRPSERRSKSGVSVATVSRRTGRCSRTETPRLRSSNIKIPPWRRPCR